MTKILREVTTAVLCHPLLYCTSNMLTLQAKRRIHTTCSIRRKKCKWTEWTKKSSKFDKNVQAALASRSFPRAQDPEGRSHGYHRPGTLRVVANFWQIFGKMSLVFGCIGTDLCKKIRVLQHFSKSTRLSSWNFWNLAKFCKFCDIICKMFAEFSQKLLVFHGFG